MNKSQKVFLSIIVFLAVGNVAILYHLNKNSNANTYLAGSFAVKATEYGWYCGRLAKQTVEECKAVVQAVVDGHPIETSDGVVITGESK